MLLRKIASVIRQTAKIPWVLLCPRGQERFFEPLLVSTSRSDPFYSLGNASSLSNFPLTFFTLILFQRIGKKNINQPGNLAHLQHWWPECVFHCFDHLASVFVLPLRLEDVMQYFEALANYAWQALNYTFTDLSLLNEEVKLMV